MNTRKTMNLSHVYTKKQNSNVCNHTNIINMKNAKKKNNHVNSRPEVSQVSYGFGLILKDWTFVIVFGDCQ